MKEAPPSKPFEMKSVSSSSHGAAGYDPISSEFRISFHSGATYSHAGVPQDVYDAYLAAGSQGQFYNARVRGKYPHSKL